MGIKHVLIGNTGGPVLKKTLPLSVLFLFILAGGCASEGNTSIEPDSFTAQDDILHTSDIDTPDAELDATQKNHSGAPSDSSKSSETKDLPQTNEPLETIDSKDSPDSQDSESQDSDVPIEWPPAPDFLGGARQAPYFLPSNYEPENPDPMPVLVVIHGFTASGSWTADWWQIHTAASEAGILLIVPDGTVDAAGNPFWNATEFCCNFYGSQVDDVGYLTGLIEEASTYFPIDMRRVYLMGHSNGGFMSHRIACEHSELIAAIVNMGGSTWYEAEDCGNPGPVSLLQVHGTWDTVILYGGLVPNIGDPEAEAINAHECLLDRCGAPYNSCLSQPSCNTMVTCFGECATVEDPQACNADCWYNASVYPQILWMEALTCGLSAGCYLADPTQDSFGYASIEDGAARWAQYNGCSESQVDGPPLDLIHEINGEDTYPRLYENCTTGTTSEVWKILYGGHSPDFNNNWAPSVIEWLLKQSKI